MNRPDYCWRVHLAANRPLRSVFALLAIGTCSLLLGWLYRSGGVALLALGLLLGSTVSYWWPREYRAFPDRLEVVYRGLPWRTVHRWERFRRVIVGEGVLFLSPFVHAGWLVRYRGVTVFLPPEGEALVRYVQERVKEWQSSAEGS